MMKRKAFSILKIIGILVLSVSLLASSSLCVAFAEQDGFYISENYATGKQVSVNNAYSKAPKENAIDQDSLSHWRTVSGHKDDFIYFILSLGKETSVNLVQLSLYNADKMRTVKLQYTTDSTPSASSTWNDIKVLPEEEIESVITLGFDEVKATGLRFYADHTERAIETSKKTAGLYDFQIYYTDNVAAAVEKLKTPDFKPFTQAESVAAKLVSVDENGKLVYADYDDAGSKLIDYSYVGYKNGEEPIPEVKVVKTLEPGDLRDHTALIQNAIDEVAALPETDRGAILLKRGTYTISDELLITASGIVLRGEGQGENGTVIYDTRKEVESTTLSISGTGDYSVVKGSKSTLVGSIPAGETKLPLSTVTSYQVGDAVRVVCTPNDLWVKTLGMDVLPGEDVTQWKPNKYVMTYERWITVIDAADKTITINTGIPLTLDEKYFSVTVEKIEESDERITQCGVENIRFLSYYNGTRDDEDHAWIALELSNCRDCWVRNVTAKHYAYATVKVATGAINVTVEGCSYLEPISYVEGSRRYSFCIAGGQYTLVKNCYSYDSRHDYVLQARVCGPNVFLDCVAEESNSASEPHHRWSNGSLYDHVYQIGRTKMGHIQVINGGSDGTGHGWKGASTVFWNCLSPAIVVGKPQTEQNFAVGVYGIYEGVAKTKYISAYSAHFVTPSVVTPNYPETKEYENSPMYGNGYVESPYNPVNPSSLYRAQLSYRLTGDATKNVAPNAPIFESPAADSKITSRTVAFSGIRDIYAEKVYLYVDGEKYAAELSGDGSYAYSAALELENGYHNVFVTQVIDGIESAPNAARTILVDSDEPTTPPETVPEETSEEETPTAGTEPKEENKPSQNSNKTRTIIAAVLVCAAIVAVFAAVCVVIRKRS